jgi:hypothetical protein
MNRQRRRAGRRAERRTDRRLHPILAAPVPAVPPGAALLVEAASGLTVVVPPRQARRSRPTAAQVDSPPISAPVVPVPPPVPARPLVRW